MLIEFSVENNRSFKNKAILSFVASSLKDLGDEAIIDAGDSTYLKGAIVYGANGSGKSNLLNSFVQMRWLVTNSSKEMQVNEPVEAHPFLLNPNTERLPAFFQTIMLIDGIKYRYGFEATENQIITEWLFESRKKKENQLFIRDQENIEIQKKFPEGKGLEKKTRSNALFLSVVAQFNGEISTLIVSWFSDLSFVHGIRDESYFSLTANLLEDEKWKDTIVQLIKFADFSIVDLKLKELDQDSSFLDGISRKQKKLLLDEYKDITLADVITYHKKYDDKGKVVGLVELSMSKHESQGTIKFFNIIGALVRTLADGGIVIIDELNARLHPLLTRKIIEMFNSQKSNPNGAQFLFTTHDTDLLDKKLFRRDQIYFTEKDQYGATNLYSLAEYKVRNDESYQRNYLKGKYGAIPFVTGFESTVFELTHG